MAESKNSTCFCYVVLLILISYFLKINILKNNDWTLLDSSEFLAILVIYIFIPLLMQKIDEWKQTS
jgi:surface polysaccharide O-acyltransferase-like enzyme